MLTSFLRKNKLYVLYYVRIMLNFVMLINYTIYNKTILNYIKTIIYRIDKLKTIFKKYCFILNSLKNKNSITKNNFHFNILKFYVITHFSKQI